MSWLTTTNLTTKFFHLSTIIQRRHNNIDESLKDGQGRWLRDRATIGSHVVDYFTRVFSSDFRGVDDELAELIQPTIAEDDNVSLCMLPSEEEINSVIDHISALKALGLDGMSAIFYQHYWAAVQFELRAIVGHFFITELMLIQLNHSFIVLLPKVEHPSCIEQYRPISLCNVAYKAISKILATRLKAVIGKLISPYQAAFVPGQVIQENIILGQELLQTMKAKRRRKGLLALKLDMAKAYDRMA